MLPVIKCCFRRNTNCFFSLASWHQRVTRIYIDTFFLYILRVERDSRLTTWRFSSFYLRVSFHLRDFSLLAIGQLVTFEKYLDNPSMSFHDFVNVIATENRSEQLLHQIFLQMKQKCSVPGLINWILERNRYENFFCCFVNSSIFLNKL